MLEKKSAANDQTTERIGQILNHKKNEKNKFNAKEENKNHSTESEESSNVLNFLSTEYFEIEKKLKSL